MPRKQIKNKRNSVGVLIGALFLIGLLLLIGVMFLAPVLKAQECCDRSTVPSDETPCQNYCGGLGTCNETVVWCPVDPDTGVPSGGMNTYEGVCEAGCYDFWDRTVGDCKNWQACTTCFFLNSPPTELCVNFHDTTISKGSGPSCQHCVGDVCNSSGIPTCCPFETYSCTCLQMNSGSCPGTPPPCKNNGDVCSSPSQCCSGLCSGGYCASCKIVGDTCSSPSQCCSGFCSGGYCASCKIDGDTCSSGGDCCSGICSGGYCVDCITNGNTCTSANQCCSGYCSGSGVCSSPPPCTPPGLACPPPPDVCCGTCAGGICSGGALPILFVNKDGTGLGLVTSIPTGINCGSDCIKSYPENVSVTLSASPQTGSTFVGWSGGGCSGIDTCTVIMGNRDTITVVTATFNSIMPSALGYIRVQATGRMVELRVISVDDAKNQNNGVVKIAMPGGIIGAADLVLTSDPNASPVRIMTTRGIRSWRRK